VRLTGRTGVKLFVALLLAGLANGAVLWKDPGPIESLDLVGGPGGSANAPQAPFTFIQEEMGGTSPKVIVRDARGKNWILKFGEEVKAETFASRIVWAAGYYSDPDYFVREGKIEGVTSLGRASAFIRDGSFRDARFELRRSTGGKGGQWSFDTGALKGTKELAGLKVLFILLSNWDAKPENMSILDWDGTPAYAVTDWGATMGRASDFSGRSKWDCERYLADSKHLVDGVDNGFAVFRFDGKHSSEILQGIRIEDVQWLMGRLGKLSDAQVDAALTASGATPEEVACFGKAFRSRLGQLMTVGQASPDGKVITRSRKEIKIIRRVPQEQ
jgi:hypothetical protein